MRPDEERVSRVVEALQRNGLDAVVCALPTNVLLLTGYWPVVGTAIAVASRAGEVALLAPDDELGLAHQGWAAEVRSFEPASLHEIRGTLAAVRQPLLDLLRLLGVEHGRLGLELGPGFEPSSYAAMNFYGGSLHDLLGGVLRASSLVPADGMLAELRSRPTSGELGRIRAACHIAERAFRLGAPLVRQGETEYEIAARFRQPLYELEPDSRIARAEGYAFCMSGSNSVQASGSYARSRGRLVEPGDFLLVHCNSCADGYWTDITRTYCLGEPDRLQLEMYQVVLAARERALAVIAPGVLASEVDRAARDELERSGFGRGFKHPTGHGVGFAAIDHNAIPRLHPRSKDRLEAGMVFNVEPAIYLEQAGGLRHCDMVAVTESGADLLTPFHDTLSELTLPVAPVSSRASARTSG